MKHIAPISIAIACAVLVQGCGTPAVQNAGANDAGRVAPEIKWTELYIGDVEALDGKGNKEAANELGRRYALGIGVEKTPWIAADWFYKYELAGGKPDWSLLPPPTTGYAEARFQFLKSLRFQNESFLPAQEISEIYLNVQKPDDVIMGWVKSIETDSNIKEYPSSNYSGDNIWEAYQFSYGVYDGYRDSSGTMDGAEFDPATRQITHYENSAVIKRYIDDASGLTDTLVQWKKSHDRHYVKKGNLYVWDISNEDVTTILRYDANTGEEVEYVNGASNKIYSTHCQYNSKYIRRCELKQNGFVIETSTYSPRGVLLEHVRLFAGACPKEAPDKIWVTRFTILEQDYRANWSKRKEESFELRAIQKCSFNYDLKAALSGEWGRPYREVNSTRKISYDYPYKPADLLKYRGW